MYNPTRQPIRNKALESNPRAIATKWEDHNDKDLDRDQLVEKYHKLACATARDMCANIGIQDPHTINSAVGAASLYLVQRADKYVRDSEAPECFRTYLTFMHNAISDVLHENTSPMTVHFRTRRRGVEAPSAEPTSELAHVTYTNDAAETVEVMDSLEHACGGDPGMLVMLRMLSEGATIADVAEVLGCSPSNVYQMRTKLEEAYEAQDA